MGPDREQTQFERIAAHAIEAGIPPELAQVILRHIIDQVLIDHEEIRETVFARQALAENTAPLE